MKKITLLFLMFIMFCSININAQITEVKFNSRISQSQVVIEGKVIGKTSFWDNLRHNIYTSNEIEVYKVFKGNISVSKLEVITPGGIVGLDKEIVEPSLSLTLNEVGVFMLEPNNINIQNSKGLMQFKPYASVQGFMKYDLGNDKASGAFDNFNGIENQLYKAITGITQSQYSVINPVNLLENVGSTSKAASITNFIPTTATAGTATTITINGSGFGATAGTVRFSRADDGGATFEDGLATEIISWNDVQIVVEVNQGAGTGPIQVVGTSTATSSQTLTVSYAELNAEFDPGSGTESYQTRHINRDGSGGYVWQMHTDFAASAANAAFVRSLDTWRCNSGINWTIGSVTTTDVVANDNINIIRMDNGSELPNGVLGRCTSRWSGCGGATIEWYVEELDIVFDDATNWNFSASAPGFTQYDFESVSVHELGHGHQLGHVINSSDIMHFSISNGQQNRAPTVNNLAGAADVQSRSIGGSVCSQTVMSNYSCGVAPVADFSGTPTSLCAGSSVSFSDLSTNTPTSWAWTFTGGTPSSSTSQNPTITYNAAGVYQVVLTATNASGSDGETKVGYITVNAAPSISSHPSSSVITEGNNTSFSVVASNATGYQWQVDMGAGFGNVSNGGVYSNVTTATLNITNATLAMNGYIYRCIATGNCAPVATSNSATLTVNAAGSAPVADFSGAPTTLCEGGSVVFTDLSTNTPTGWVWSFTGGTPSSSTSPNPIITYNTAGTYTVVLTATNSFGSDGETKVGYITVNASPSLSSQPSNSVITEGNNTSFSVIASNATGYQWQVNTGSGFGNVSNGGVYSNATTATLNITGATLAMNGYTYRCIASGNCTPSATSNSATLTVNPAPVIPTTYLKPQYEKTFLAYSEKLACYQVANAQEYEWEFTPSGGGAPIIYNWARNNPSLLLGWAGLADGITYDVRVRVKVGGVFGSFGLIKQLTTPGNSNLSSIVNTYCGKIYTSYAELLNCYTVANATEYEFEFNPSGGGSIVNFVHTGNSILLSWTTGLVDNTTYNVRVRAKVGGTFGAYGNSCPITTPSSSNTTSLKTSYCSVTYTSMSAKLACYSVVDAEDYEWEFTPVGGGTVLLDTAISTSPSILINFIPGIQEGVSYDVRIRPRLSGVYGSFGSSCEITTPSGTMITQETSRLAYSDEESIIDNSTTLSIYPNPNSGEQLNVNLEYLTPNSTLTITDIYGKVILTKQLNTDQSEYRVNMKFENKLSAGFYLVSISSEGNTITEKLIVR